MESGKKKMGMRFKKLLRKANYKKISKMIKAGKLWMKKKKKLRRIFLINN